jgi:hypothetical protein
MIDHETARKLVREYWASLTGEFGDLVIQAGTTPEDLVLDKVHQIESLALSTPEALEIGGVVGVIKFLVTKVLALPLTDATLSELTSE